MVIFSVVEIDEKLDFVGFARSVYRSDFGMKILGNAYFIRSLWME